jgi:hypothetical protein
LSEIPIWTHQREFGLRRSEKTATKRKSGKRILGLITDEGGSAFFGKGCCENAQVPGGREKRRLERFFKSWMPSTVLLSKEIVSGHPCIPRVRVNKGGDKRRSLRKKGRSWYGREGGEGAGQIQGVKG